MESLLEQQKFPPPLTVLKKLQVFDCFTETRVPKLLAEETMRRHIILYCEKCITFAVFFHSIPTILPSFCSIIIELHEVVEGKLIYLKVEKIERERL